MANVAGGASFKRKGLRVDRSGGLVQRPMLKPGGSADLPVRPEAFIRIRSSVCTDKVMPLKAKGRVLAETRGSISLATGGF